MTCHVCKKAEAKHPGSTCGLKCATDAYPRGDSYEKISERLQEMIEIAKRNNGFSVGHGGKA